MSRLRPIILFFVVALFVSQSFAVDQYTALNRYRSYTNEDVVPVLDLRMEKNYYVSNSKSLRGMKVRVSDPRVDEVSVQGVRAVKTSNNLWQTNKEIQLNPGLTRLVVEAKSSNVTVAKKHVTVLVKSRYTTKRGQISRSAVWTKKQGPYLVDGTLSVSSSGSLTIEAGTTVFFERGSRIEVEGKLRALGSEYEMIHFTISPDSRDYWDGIKFSETHQDNKISYASFTNAGTKDSGMVEARKSKVTVENSYFGKCSKKVKGKLYFTYSINKVVGNHFTSPYTEYEVPKLEEAPVHIKAKYAPVRYGFSVENNIFEKLKGHTDAIDYSVNQYYGFMSDSTPPEFKGDATIRYNAFLGGGDDALDFDANGTIEGNFFTNFHKDQWNLSKGQSNAISTGKKARITVHNNVFYNIGILGTFKAKAFATFTHNTVVKVPIAVALYNPKKKRQGFGKGCKLEGNLFYRVNDAIKYDDLKRLDIEVDYNYLPYRLLTKYGSNNIDMNSIEPGFVNPKNLDFRLRSDSELRGKGPRGKDLGIY